MFTWGDQSVNSGEMCGVFSIGLHSGALLYVDEMRLSYKEYCCGDTRPDHHTGTPIICIARLDDSFCVESAEGRTLSSSTLNGALAHFRTDCYQERLREQTFTQGMDRIRAVVLAARYEGEDLTLTCKPLDCQWIPIRWPQATLALPPLTPMPQQAPAAAPPTRPRRSPIATSSPVPAHAPPAAPPQAPAPPPATVQTAPRAQTLTSLFSHRPARTPAAAPKPSPASAPGLIQSVPAPVHTAACAPVPSAAQSHKPAHAPSPGTASLPDSVQPPLDETACALPPASMHQCQPCKCQRLACSCTPKAAPAQLQAPAPDDPSIWQRP